MYSKFVIFDKYIRKIDFFHQNKVDFSAQLESIGNWLYEEGDDEAKEVYVEKLLNLKVHRIHSVEFSNFLAKHFVFPYRKLATRLSSGTRRLRRGPRRLKTLADVCKWRESFVNWLTRRFVVLYIIEGLKHHFIVARTRNTNTLMRLTWTKSERLCWTSKAGLTSRSMPKVDAR